MAVKRGPLEIVRNGDVLDTANRLRELADRVERDANISGVVAVVYSRTGGEERVRLFRTGALRRMRQIAAWAMMKGMEGILSDD